MAEPSRPAGRGRGPAGQPLARRPDFQLASARVTPSVRRITGRAGSASVEPRVMRVLLAFVDAGPVVLTRDELLRQCWDGAVVGDDAINRAIAEIRKVARETDAGFGIETIPRVGYRLTLEAAQPAVPGADSDASADESAMAAAAARPPRLARRHLLAGVLAVSVAAIGGAALYGRNRSNARFALLVEQGRQALRLGEPGDLVRARQLLEQAVQLRADDPAALGLLALALHYLAMDTPVGVEGTGREELLREATRSATEALAIDPAEPNAGLVMALLDWRGDWHATERRLRGILVVDPDNFSALDALVALLQGAGYLDDSNALNEEALRRHPQRPNPAWRRALKLWISGRDADAGIAATAVLDRWPGHQLAWQAALVVYAFTHEFGAARRLLEQPGKMLSEPGRAAWLEWVRALEERTPAAILAARGAVARVADRPLLAAHAIMVLSEVGVLDAAYELFESRSFLPALDAGQGPQRENTASRWHQWLFAPAAANLRAHPRFERACERLGLIAYWRARGELPDVPLGEWQGRVLQQA